MEKLAILYYGKGDFQKSFEYADQIRREVNQPGKGITTYIMLLARLGRKEEAQLYLEQLHRRAEEDSKITLDSDFCGCYAALGDMDKAFYYLDSCYKKHLGTILYPLRYPFNQLFNKDERFWQLLEKMGLKKYYEEARVYST